MAVSTTVIETCAMEAISVLETGQQIAPFSSRHPDFSLDDAYRVTAAVRRRRLKRGERSIGRKIGFTNRTTWPDYDPMWSDVYDQTVYDLTSINEILSLAALVEPRIEPEIAFRLSSTPAPDMDERALLTCIDAVAHGFEVVQSIFSAWVFTAPDAVAGFGLHGMLVLGPWHPIGDEVKWQKMLSTFEIDLICDGDIVDHGHATNVLGGPLIALRHLVALLADDAVNPPLAAGEIVTTGTLTRVPPVASGQTWTTTVTGIALEGIAVRFI